MTVARLLSVSRSPAMLLVVSSPIPTSQCSELRKNSHPGEHTFAQFRDRMPSILSGRAESR